MPFIFNSGRAIAWGFAAFLLSWIPAYGQAGPPIADEQIFHIPAQPVDGALAVFATASRISIAFETKGVAHLQSHPLRGRHTPQTALRVLLTGTGLTARFTGPTSAIVFATPRVASTTGSRADLPSMRLDLAEVRAPRLIGRADPSTDMAYARQAETELRAMLETNPSYRGRSLRLRIAVRIGSTGVIDDVELIRDNGDAMLAQQVPTALQGRRLSAPPPANLSQPLRFDIATVRFAGGD